MILDIQDTYKGIAEMRREFCANNLDVRENRRNNYGSNVIIKFNKRKDKLVIHVVGITLRKVKNK